MISVFVLLGQMSADLLARWTFFFWMLILTSRAPFLPQSLVSFFSCPWILCSFSGAISSSFSSSPSTVLSLVYLIVPGQANHELFLLLAQLGSFCWKVQNYIHEQSTLCRFLLKFYSKFSCFLLQVCCLHCKSSSL